MREDDTHRGGRLQEWRAAPHFHFISIQFLRGFFDDVKSSTRGREG